MSSVPHVHVAIAGSGFAGLGMAIELKKKGIDDFLVFERAVDLGGVWRDNEYPGCACDVESHLYSFSFAPNPNWSRSFSPQPEILEYLRGCADRFGVRDRVRLQHEILSAAWENERWSIHTSRGDYTADFLVSGTGGLSDPILPDLPGTERFRGRSFHSARWDKTVPLAGKRVAVIGTGASAIQFIPAIQPQVGKLLVFQRTPAWVIPRRDRSIPGRWKSLFRSSPLLHAFVRALLYVFHDLFVLAFHRPRFMRFMQRLAYRHMRKSISDPVLQKKLTPDYTLGCKRILLSDNYYPALAQPNVEVLTTRIREIREHSIVTEDGVEHEVDTIIYGTGFRVTDPPIAERVRGAGGLTLSEVWRGSPFAHLGTTVTGFPNLFILLGPNTGLGHSSVVLMIEYQIAHVMRAFDHLRKTHTQLVEPKAEAQAKFLEEVDAKLANTVWNSGGCKSWYLDSTGRNSTLWPGSTWAFKRRMGRFDPREYVFSPKVGSAERPAPRALPANLPEAAH
jgi:cation diffusion facilitator CzcD-associated flavoprotein CzcO